MKRYQNLLLMIAVVVLAAVPLRMLEKPAPGPDGKVVEIFKGADDQAKNVIHEIAPGYRPWFKPLMAPPGEEINTLFFTLQAALGAGFIGYYLGMSVTRARMRRELDKEAEC
ncbi:MAG: energy-coupling factor ABC transporter substrate-binding protein [Desulfuromonadales bacterium]